MTHCQQEATAIAEALKALVTRAARVGVNFGDHVFKDAAAQMEVIRSRLLDRAG